MTHPMMQLSWERSRAVYILSFPVECLVRLALVFFPLGSPVFRVFLLKIEYPKIYFSYFLMKNNQHGPIAQLGERTVRIRKVVGSIPIGSTKMEIAAVFTAAISRLTTEIPQTDFCFDHLKGTPFSEGVPFILLFTLLQNLNIPSAKSSSTQKCGRHLQSRADTQCPKRFRLHLLHHESTVFSQFFDLEFERRISANIVVFSPYMFKEFFFGHHFSNAVRKELQHIKLLRSQV